MQPLLNRLAYPAATVGNDACFAAADAACAAAIAALPGDINAAAGDAWNRHSSPMLHIVARRNAPCTLAAFAARSDTDPYRFDTQGNAPLMYAVMCGMVTQFLDAFPALDVNAPCQSFGITPLAFCALHWETAWRPRASLDALLDGGAEFGEHMWGSLGRPRHTPLCWETDPALAVVVIAHMSWSWAAQRRAWMVACVSLARCEANLSPPPNTTVLAHLLADALQRLCTPPCFGAPSHQLASEYAYMVAAFL